jgi:Carboxypeptidase regulatory-like domain
MNTKFQSIFGFLLCFLLLLFPIGSLRSQNNPSPSPDGMTYENHNQIDPHPLSVRSLAGNVQGLKGEPIPNASLGLFTETEHKLVTSAQTSQDGTFKFSGVQPGRYRLVVKCDGLCPANIPIAMNYHALGSRPIYVYMRPRGIDSCSYGQIGPKRKQ